MGIEFVNENERNTKWKRWGREGGRRKGGNEKSGKGGGVREEGGKWEKGKVEEVGESGSREGGGGGSDKQQHRGARVKQTQAEATVWGDSQQVREVRKWFKGSVGTKTRGNARGREKRRSG